MLRLVLCARAWSRHLCWAWCCVRAPGRDTCAAPGVVCARLVATHVQAAWEREGVQPSEDQVLLREWLPQNDLLGSGRIAVFVTQGGYLSMQVRTPSLCTTARRSLPLTDLARAPLGHVAAWPDPPAAWPAPGSSQPLNPLACSRPSRG